MPQPGLLLEDEARSPMRRGLDALADLLGLTLGPLQGGVVAARAIGAPAEYLTDAATIARRFLSLPDRAESAGAMLLRNLVWRQHLDLGDGCATAAVLARAMVAEGERLLAAGVNAADLRRGIEAAAEAAAGALAGMARPLEGADDLLALALSLCADRPLALALAEIFELLGPEAAVEIEEYVAPYLEREYHAGGRWQARLASPIFVSDQARQRAVLQGCAVVVYDGDLRTLDDVRGPLELAAAREPARLLLIARAISGDALATLAVNHQRGPLELAGVALQRSGERQAADFADIAALSGARLYRQEADRPADITAEGLGQARRAEANATHLLLTPARPGPALRAQIESLRGAIDHAPAHEADRRDELARRVARLSGASATLKVGAVHKVEREALRRRAEGAQRALRGALRGGVVAGGGAALLACAPAALAAAPAGDVGYGHRVVARALEAPMRQIVANAGRADAAAIVAAARARGPGWGYEAQSGELADMAAAGVLDSAATLAAALRSAASGAAMLLTTGALILKRNPQMSFEP